MSLFEEIKIDTTIIDKDIYVNARQLAWHISRSMEEFYLDAKMINQARKLSKDESIFANGIIEGMYSILLLLSQGGIEEELNLKINTVQDLIDTLGENHE